MGISLSSLVWDSSQFSNFFSTVQRGENVCAFALLAMTAALFETEKERKNRAVFK